MPTKRPDMRAYFRARIDWHVNGMLARTHASPPAGVAKVNGDVTDRTIVVTMRDGTTHQWTGGQYARRKIAGCHAPLMPRPSTDENGR